MLEHNRRAKFLAKCIKDPVTGCWNWNGMMSNNGYGQVKRDGKFFFTHRYSWMLHRGEIPAGMVVCHQCDNRKCCNPDHLWIGTQKQNQQDMKAKKRHVHGERSPNAKLKEADVLRMYDLHEGGMGEHRLAREFGVSGHLTWLITRGKAWKHLYEARYGT